VFDLNEGLGIFLIRYKLEQNLDFFKILGMFIPLLKDIEDRGPFLGDKTGLFWIVPESWAGDQLIEFFNPICFAIYIKDGLGMNLVFP